MRLEKSQTGVGKGWYVGPWNSDLNISIGYANIGVDEPHLHAHITEIYMVARGVARIRVERETITLQAGDIMVVEPGEAHTFIESSPDYFHFVVQTPALSGEIARKDKISVATKRLEI